MLNKKNFRLSVLCCLFGIQAFSQGTTLGGGQRDSKMTAGQGSTMSIGNIFSPNLYNGTANISVPIYDFDAYGVSLSYNTAGVKVNEVSGLVGTHWDLNAGGSITRKLKDVPDEMNSNPSYMQNVYMGNTAGPGGSPSAGTNGINIVYAKGVKGKFAQYFGTTPAVENEGRYIDGESDDFIFAVGGLSFTFNIGANGFVFTHPHNNVKIEMILDGVTTNQMPVVTTSDQLHYNYKQNLTFKVTDAQGNQYFFIEGDVNTLTFSDGMRSNSMGDVLELNYISKWVIQKVILSNGSEINYQYLDEVVGHTDVVQSFSAVEEPGKFPAVAASQVMVNNYVSSKLLASISYPNYVTASFIYLSGNIGSNTYIERNCEASGPILKEIRIESTDNYTKCTRYVMRQVYSIAQGGSTALGAERDITSVCGSVPGSVPSEFFYRLTLKGVDILSCDGSQTEPYYSFEYNGMPLPPRSSGSQDYFGYYNGKAAPAPNFNGLLDIPWHMSKYGTSPAVWYGVDKTEDALFAAAGILTKVKNAYGSTLTLEYEANVLETVINNPSYTNHVTLPADAYFLGRDANDGLRVKSMTTTDKHYPGKFVKQLYSYSGGQRFLAGGYFDYPLWTSNSPAEDNTIFCGSFISPHQMVNGSNHGYSKVTITTVNETGGPSLHRKEIEYSNFYDPETNTLAYYKIGNNYYETPYTDKQYIKDWELGLPRAITEYDQNGNKTSVTFNDYNFGTPQVASSLVLPNTKKLNVISAPYGDIDLKYSEVYRPYTGIALLTATITLKYTDNATAMIDRVDYTYDAKNNPKTTLTYDSRGVTSLSNNIYNYDLTDQPGSTLATMNANGLEKLVSVERWKKGSQVSEDQLMDASITKYKYDGNKLRVQKNFMLQSLAPVAQPNYASNAVILSAYNNAQPPANLQITSEVLQTDADGHATEMKQIGENIYSSMIWDDRNNMAAAVNNARLKDIGFTSFERLPTGNSNNNTTVLDGGFIYRAIKSQVMGVPVSGAKIYNLMPGFNIKSPVLTAGQEYIITLWSNGAAPIVSGIAPVVSGAGVTLDFKEEYSNSNWKFYKAVFTPTQNGILEFSSTSTIKLDEIRLFPSGTSMKSSVYIPFLGKTSDTDPTGRITYYEYDAFGRLVITRNQEGNIISKKEFHVGQ